MAWAWYCLCARMCAFAGKACGWWDKWKKCSKERWKVVSLSGETEAKDVEKSTDPADYEIGTRDHYLAVWRSEKGLSYAGSRKSGTVGNRQDCIPFE
ncbi:MAG: hypothetical protein ACLTDV_04445 [Eubacterium sp.]